MDLEELLEDIDDLSQSTIDKVLESNDIFVKFAENSKGAIKAYRMNGNKEQSDYTSNKKEAIVVLLKEIIGYDKDNDSFLFDE